MYLPHGLPHSCCRDRVGRSPFCQRCRRHGLGAQALGPKYGRPISLGGGYIAHDIAFETRRGLEVAPGYGVDIKALKSNRHIEGVGEGPTDHRRGLRLQTPLKEARQYGIFSRMISVVLPDDACCLTVTMLPLNQGGKGWSVVKPMLSQRRVERLGITFILHRF